MCKGIRALTVLIVTLGFAWALEAKVPTGTMAGIVVVSLLTSVPEEAQWRPFQWSLAALKHFDEGARRPWYQSALLWWIVYTIVWAYLYWRFW